MLDFIPLPFIMSDYSLSSLVAQISLKLIVFSHIPTTVIALALTIFLYKRTKQLSVFYLLLITSLFTLWSYFDLLAWTAEYNALMFGWSLINLINVLFTAFTYWFLYAFIKGKDVPFWQKLTSLAFVVPVAVYTLLSINMHAFFQPIFDVSENRYTAFYVLAVNVLFLIAVVILTYVGYRGERNSIAKRKILLGGVGTSLFLFIFTLSQAVSNMLINLNITNMGEAYNSTTYSLFGMPIFIGFLGYLVAKYQAFDIKLVKSIQAMFILMVLLFVYLFI